MNQRTRANRRSPWPWVGALAVAALALVVAVIVVAGGTGDDEAGPPAAPEDPGVAHVHGLGIDQADGSLYAATHHGVYRVPDAGEADRVGDGFQDTMGFTVVGEQHFLGSGHPDAAGMREGQPGQLGLIESTDAGETWRTVALSGEVDFHALAFAHDLVYGWDSGSGRFMVSADRQQWETRSTLDLYGFAVDPADPDHIIAATPTGLKASTDGGREWSILPGAPVVVLAWDATKGVWGVEADGQVQHSSDGGTTWASSGTLPGPPQALLVTSDTLYAAAEEDGLTGIYRSTDGETWALRYRDGGS